MKELRKSTKYGSQDGMSAPLFEIGIFRMCSGHRTDAESRLKL